MPRKDQVTRQWHLLRKLEGSRGASIRELAESLPDDFPKHPRTIRRDLAALEAAGFPLLTARVDGWILSFGSGVRAVQPEALREQVQGEARKIALGRLER